MEQSLDPLKLIKNETLAQEARALYTFFTDAEISGTHFTYTDIDDHSSRSPSTIRKYARNYWSWFLRKEPEKRGRSAVFSCHGLKGYPEFYFVMAHQYNQVQHYRHFYEALLKARERAEEARRAKLQDTQSTEVPSAPLPSVPGQQLPEALHFEELPPDDEVEEDETDGAEPTQDLNGITQQQESDNRTTSEIAHIERMNVMSIFPFGKNPRREEQLEQIRTEFQNTMNLLERRLVEQMTSSFTNSIQTLGQTLIGEIQGLQVPLDQVRTELVDRAQVLERTLIEEIQRLNTSLDLPQIHTEFTNTVKTLEINLIQEIKNLQVSSELSQISEKLDLLQDRAQVLSSLVPQTSSISEKLNQLQEEVHNLSSLVSQPSPVSERLNELQKQALDLASAEKLGELHEEVTKLSSLISQLSIFVPSGEQKSVDKSVQARIQAIFGAINDLEREYASWVGQHDRSLQKTKQDLDQQSLALQKTKQDLDQQSLTLQKIHMDLVQTKESLPMSTTDISPNPDDEKDQQNSDGDENHQSN